MKTHDKHVIFNQSGCLNRDQLQRYSKDELTPADQHLVEKHLIDCELCSEALEGFSMILDPALTDATLAAVKAMTPAAKTNVGMTRFWLSAAVIVVAIFSTLVVYHYLYESPPKDLAERPAKVTPASPPTPTAVPSVKELPVKVITEGIKKNIPLKPDQKEDVSETGKRDNTAGNKTVYDLHVAGSAEPGEALAGDDNLQAPAAEVVAEEAADAESIAPATETSKTIRQSKVAESMPSSVSVRAQDVRYIEGLKTKIYLFRAASSDSLLLAEKQGIEARFENAKDKKATLEADNQELNTPGYEALLRHAMYLFRSKDYPGAIREFNHLLERHSGDENALFYGALSYHATGKYREAKQYLHAVLSNRLTLFGEEARWNMALVELDAGNQQEALRLLRRIEKENGFYSRQAAEKITTIK